MSAFMYSLWKTIQDVHSKHLVPLGSTLDTVVPVVPVETLNKKYYNMLHVSFYV